MIARVAAAAGREAEITRLRVAETSRVELLTALVCGSCLAAVVPMALAIVEQDPMATAGRFDGDLLRGLMEVRGNFWTPHPQLYNRFRSVVRRAALARSQMPADARMEFWSPLDVLT